MHDSRFDSVFLSNYDYHLPERLIAFYPLPNREESKLMVVSKNDHRIEHRRFYEISDFLEEGDVLVLNNTKVIPARLFGRTETGRELDLLLTEMINPRLWRIIIRKPKQGMMIEFGGSASSLRNEVLRGRLVKENDEQWMIEFEEPADDYIERAGMMPLPPYIKREPEENDRVSYQTVYAEKRGAIAAPTAGLHFTENLIGDISEKGVEIRYVTLHVGAGTFKPVKTEDIREHSMHPEYREISPETASAVNSAKKEGRRIVAVGTTVVRSLESAADGSGNLQPGSGYTDLFIYPGFKFRIADALITNFHMPRSTLLMLVSAFAGRELIFKTYEEAKREKYRFLSYGDAMLIL